MLNEEIINEVEIVDPYGFIYITTNMINGKKYIGQRKYYEDWKTYLGSGNLLLEAIKKYGKENFSREIIAISYSKEELDILEIESIKLHNAVKNKDYYNISYGGGTNSGICWSDETKKKMSDAKKGVKNSRYGTHHTEESKQKMSESTKGENNPNYRKQRSEETKAKWLKAVKGQIRTEEAKKRMSDAHIKINPEQVKEIRNKYATGEYRQYELAEEYSIGQSTINNIINYKNAYKK